VHVLSALLADVQFLFWFNAYDSTPASELKAPTSIILEWYDHRFGLGLPIELTVIWQRRAEIITGRICK
jgi:hypothetical protein